jgi:hypothetical protein
VYLLPSDQLQLIKAWVLQGVESIPQGCWPMLTPMLTPLFCQVDWMSFGWWTILDTHRKLLSVKNPAVLLFFTQTSAPGSYYHTLFKGTYII